MLETADIVLRSATASVCILLMVQFGSLRPITRKSASVIALALSVFAMVVCWLPAAVQFQAKSDIWLYFSFFVQALNAPVIAWAMLEVFEDDFEIKPWQTAFLMVSIPSHFLQLVHPVFATLCHVSSIVIYGYLFYVACKTRHCDLVWSRREFRKWFLTAIAIAGVGFTALSMFIGQQAVVSLPTSVFKSFIILVLAITFMVWATKVRTNLWASPGASATAKGSTLNFADNALLSRLEAAMEEGAWRQEGLTIRALAEQLDAQEHRLRRVINQGLGYRNFAAFLNERRIQAACEVLADPKRVEMPVLSVAYDVGYASLGPFNRAFRELMGISPTQFRKQAVIA